MRRAQVEERKQPAREVHDTVAQKLTGLALRLEAADALMLNERERARATFRQAVDLTHAALDDVRRSVVDLRAAPLERLSLGEALRSLINAFGREQHISARFESLGPTMPLSPRIEVGAFRTVREALTNVARHAAARPVAVALRVDAVDGSTPNRRRLELRIEDDERGFDPAPPGGSARAAPGGVTPVAAVERRKR